MPDIIGILNYCSSDRAEVQNLSISERGQHSGMWNQCRDTECFWFVLSRSLISPDNECAFVTEICFQPRSQDVRQEFSFVIKKGKTFIMPLLNPKLVYFNS